jgi:hypothetical protein
MHEFEIRCRNANCEEKYRFCWQAKDSSSAIVLQMIAFSHYPPKPVPPLQGWWQIFLKHKTEKGWILGKQMVDSACILRILSRMPLWRGSDLVGNSNTFRRLRGQLGLNLGPKRKTNLECGEFRMHQKFTVPQNWVR